MWTPFGASNVPNSAQEGNAIRGMSTGPNQSFKLANFKGARYSILSSVGCDAGDCRVHLIQYCATCEESPTSFAVWAEAMIIPRAEGKESRESIEIERFLVLMYYSFVHVRF